VVDEKSEYVAADSAEAHEANACRHPGSFAFRTPEVTGRGRWPGRSEGVLLTSSD
jgi:hypothetical protein